MHRIYWSIAFALLGYSSCGGVPDRAAPGTFSIGTSVYTSNVRSTCEIGSGTYYLGGNWRQGADFADVLVSFSSRPATSGLYAAVPFSIELDAGLARVVVANSFNTYASTEGTVQVDVSGAALTVVVTRMTVTAKSDGGTQIVSANLTCQ